MQNEIDAAREDRRRLRDALAFASDDVRAAQFAEGQRALGLKISGAPDLDVAQAAHADLLARLGAVEEFLREQEVEVRRAAEAGRAARETRAIAARETLVVARMAVDAATLARLQAGARGDVGVYEQAVAACDAAHDGLSRAEAAVDFGEGIE